MKFLCNKVDISKAVSTVSRIVGSQITMPIFSNILIDAENDKVTFYGTDNELFMKYSIPAEVKRVGKATVSAEYFSKAAAAASISPKDSIAIEVTDDFKGTIDASKGKDKFVASSADGYILPSDMVGGVEIPFSVDEFKELVDKTKICISKDENKPNIRGFCISVANGKVKFVSTDIRWLALVERECEFNNEFEITIPLKCVNEISLLLSNVSEEKFLLKFNDKQVMFSCGVFELSSRLIGEKFPDYWGVMLSAYKIQLEINTVAFKNAVDYVMHNAENNAYMLRLEVLENGLVFSAKSCDTGSDSTYELECVRTGEETEQVAIVFNALYLKEICRVIDTDICVMQIIGAL